MPRYLLLILPAALWAQKPQPIPFSHRVHVQAGLKCADCHPIPAPGDQATFPKEDKCMACHLAIRTDSPAIRKLAEFHKQGKRVPWSRIYTVADYVVFSHDLHHRQGKVACETCHGPVAERDALEQEKSVSMKTCMDCHDERKASNECNVCHPPF
jgi:hypothetical protein